MNNCSNHIDRKAFSICHGCGKEFCKSCLDEGIEYYYCKNPGCQKLFEIELPPIKAPENIICPNCDSESELSDDERMKGKTHCSECESVIDFTVNPPKILERENYTEILSSLNQGDIALIKSILEDGGINYFTLGENFLSVRPLLEPMKILVNDKQLSEAKELLKDVDLKIFGASNRQY
ncbi:MAG: hypothetical protein GY936_08550 [Ignavibacteriae bacterium]|nr:hypothetical protein [Ignavibacteriota bacterium]